MVHPSHSSSPSVILLPPAFSVLHLSAFSHFLILRTFPLPETAAVPPPSVFLLISVELLESEAAQNRPYKDSSWPDHTSVPESMEAKAKSGAPAPKAAPKAEKKEPAAPRKADPAPAAPEPEHLPPQDGAAEAEAAAGDEAAASGTDSLEQLKPFLIGGAVIAAGAILLGVLLLARRN